MTHKLSWFKRFAHATSSAAGKPISFVIALVIVIVWAATGPVFGFSDTWQLVINTGTTILTFLMVFLIQNTQNREAMAVQLKLDELIRVLKEAHNELLDAEDFDEKDLKLRHKEMVRLADEAQNITNAGETADPGNSN
jgi:low affinity Fe/Cu permease